MNKRDHIRDTAIFVIIGSSFALAAFVITAPVVLILDVPVYDGDTGRLLSAKELLIGFAEAIGVGVAFLVIASAVLRWRAQRRSSN